MRPLRLLAAIGILLGAQVLAAQVQTSSQDSQSGDLSQRACLPEIPQNHIRDNVYTNDSIGFTYTFPVGWKPEPIKFVWDFVGGTGLQCMTSLTLGSTRKGRYNLPEWSLEISTYNPAYLSTSWRKPWDPAGPNADDLGFKPSGNRINFSLDGQAFVGQVYCGTLIKWCGFSANTPRAGYMLTLVLRTPNNNSGKKVIQEFISGKGDLASGVSFSKSAEAN